MECKQEYKFERRERKLHSKRRHKLIDKAKISTDKVVPPSKKDIYIVSGYKNNDKTDEFEIKINGSRFVGDKEEYKEIKQMCEEKLKAIVRILQIVSG